MTLDVNGERRQTGNTETMIFSIAHYLHYISQFMVLEPGDVVTTGTPPGVALGMKPPVWLKPGDEIRMAIEGSGESAERDRAVPDVRRTLVELPRRTEAAPEIVKRWVHDRTVLWDRGPHRQ